MSLWALKAIDTLLLARPHLLNFPKQPLTTGDQEFKCLRHLGDISLKLPLFVVFVHMYIHMHVCCVCTHVHSHACLGARGVVR